VTTFAPVAFLAMAGFLLGGAWSMRSQGKPLALQGALVVVGVGCLALGLAYLLGER
jgi:hypothetical protein